MSISKRIANIILEDCSITTENKPNLYVRFQELTPFSQEHIIEWYNIKYKKDLSTRSIRNINWYEDNYKVSHFYNSLVRAVKGYFIT